MNDRRRTLALVDAYVDGELPPEDVLEVESRLEEDDELVRERVRFTAALKASVKEAFDAPVAASAGFEERLLAALAAERAQASDAAVPARSAPRRTFNDEARRPLPWAVVLPLAAAAGAMIVAGASQQDTVRSSDGALAEAPSAVRADLGAGPAIERILDELVDHHVRGPEPELLEAERLAELSPAVGVPVHQPRLAELGASWIGGRIVPVQDPRQQRAASLSYRMGGHRITVYVYDAGRLPLRARLEPVVVRNIPVYVGQRRGYSIAAVESRGVGYALASDFADNEAAELVTASMY